MSPMLPMSPPSEPRPADGSEQQARLAVAERLACDYPASTR